MSSVSDASSSFAPLPDWDPAFGMDTRHVHRAICLFGHAPHLLTNYFVHLLRRYFAEADLIRDQSLRDLIWIPDDASPLKILPVELYDPKAEHHRPLVVVEDTDYVYGRHGLDDRTQDVGPVGDGATEHYCTPVSTAHRFHCLTRSRGEAPLLRTEIEQLLLSFRSMMREDLNLTSLRLTRATAGQDLGEGHDGWKTTIELAYTLDRSVDVQAQEPLVRRIRFWTNPAV